jgi:hypothetical protein
MMFVGCQWLAPYGLFQLTINADTVNLLHIWISISKRATQNKTQHLDIQPCPKRDSIRLQCSQNAL